MTTPTEALIAVLRADSGVQALVAQGNSPETYRIYNMVMVDTQNKPTVVLQKISQTRENTMSDAGGNGVENARLRVTAYAKTISDAEALQEACRIAIMAAAVLNASQLMNIDDFDDGTKLYQVIVDYSIWYRH